AALQKLLGELLVSTTLLTATLKFEGSITIQLQGDGPVSLAVINGDNEQKIRGVARWEGHIADDATLHDMMGKGYMVITIEPKKGERYQGIVGLEGDNLEQVLEGYFERSEQLKTRIWIRTGEHEGKAHAAGMLIQVMPDGTGSENDFEHLEQLTNTVKNEELFTLPANELLYRLYNQEQVRLFEPQNVEFRCGCSRERSGAAIVTVDKNEIYDILASDGSVS
ncbi:Hsp33 family molecular chaperone HslO, partial [Vibrio vulnificus]